MTQRQVLIVDFTEIKTVEVTCSNCEGSIIFRLPQPVIPKYQECPSCNKPLWDADKEHTHDRLQALLANLTSWQELDNKRVHAAFVLAG